MQKYDEELSTKNIELNWLSKIAAKIKTLWEKR